ncbi:MAG TPA: sensor histidine kinase [Chloroflexi bacterium]|nr:sensor histidine kinase [Chloroflexota bacterium]
MSPSALLSRLAWINYVGLGTLGVVALIIFGSYTPEDERRWLALGVIGVLTVLLFLDDRLIRRPIVRHSCYILTALALLALIALNANLTGFVIIGFLLSGTAMASLPPRAGYLWILLYGATTLLYTTLIWPGNMQALLSALGILAGYLFMGATIDAQRKAERAEAEAQLLLAKLQEAHMQLQESAQQAEALAVAEERNRLAREVHDTLGHRLTVAAVQLEGAQRLISHDPVRAAQMVATVHTQVIEGLNELRRTVAALRAPLSAEVNLPAALLRLARDFETATGMEVELRLADALPTLTSAQRQVFYRVAQEALTNVQRHAAASRVRVTLQQGDDEAVRLTLDDDGCGLPAMPAPGFGLRGMTERAQQIGAQLQLGNSALGGARVELSLVVGKAAVASEVT